MSLDNSSLSKPCMFLFTRLRRALHFTRIEHPATTQISPQALHNWQGVPRRRPESNLGVHNVLREAEHYPPII
jgi:hypothetical protein